MKNKTIPARLTALALALLLCGGAVMATEEERVSQDIPREERPIAVQPEGASGEQTTTAQGQPETGAAQTAPRPDPEGVVSFANLAQRVRTGNLDSRMLEETIAGVEATDYKKLEDELKTQINGIASLQELMYMTGNSVSARSMQSSYNALRDTLDDLQDGTLQRDAADGVRQMRAAQDSMVMMAESIYAQMAELDATHQTMERTLAALDRQIRELELRYELGQVSAQTVQQAKAGRAELVSGMQTLEMGLESGLMGLQYMMGAPLTDPLTLAPLPTVTGEQLDAMQPEEDLASAKAASYELYAAKKTLDDEKELFDQAKKDYLFDDYRYIQAQHDWQAAQYTYDSAQANFELSFRTLYGQVKDYRQVLEAAQTALAVEESNLQVDRLKYEQGTISHNALLAAEDELGAAQDAVNTAQRNLFVAYNNYRWAVDHGILN